MLNNLEDIKTAILSSDNLQREKIYNTIKDRKDDEIINILIEALFSKNRAVRLDAANQLILIRTNVIKKLNEKFKDSDNEDFIYWTIYVASKIKTDEAIKFLLSLIVSEDKKKATFSISAFKEIKDKRLVLPLIKCFTSKHWIIRKTAFDTLVEYGNLAVESLETTFAKTVKYNVKNENLNYWTIKTLANIINHKAVEVLKPYFDKVSINVKIYILVAIEETKAIQGLDILLKCIDGNIEILRDMAYDILVKFDKKIVKQLIDIFKTSKKAITKKKLLEAIAEILKDEAIIYLKDIFKNGDIETKYYVISAFGKIKNESIIKTLINLIPVSIYYLKEHITDILAELNEYSIEILQEYAENKNEEIQLWCIKALAKMGWIGVMPLSELLISENPITRSFVIDALGTVNSPTLIAPLIDAFNDELWTNRNAAYKNLLAYGKDVIIPLIKIIDINNENYLFWGAKVLKDTQDSLKIVDEFLKSIDKSSTIFIINALFLLTFYDDEKSRNMIIEYAKYFSSDIISEFLKKLTKYEEFESVKKVLDIFSKFIENIYISKIQGYIEKSIDKHEKDIILTIENTENIDYLKVLPLFNNELLKGNSKFTIFSILSKFVNKNLETFFKFVIKQNEEIIKIYDEFFIEHLGEKIFDDVNILFDSLDNSNEIFEYTKKIRMKIRQIIIAKEHEKKLLEEEQRQQNQSLTSIFIDLKKK